MFLYLIRKFFSLGNRHTAHIAEQRKSSTFKLKVEATLRKYEQRLSYRQKKIGLMVFCIASTAFFTWLLIQSLGRDHLFQPSVGTSMIAPVPPIRSDTHPFSQVWQQLQTYSDSIHLQSLQHDSVKDH
jgi:hypothetical protein